MALNFGEAASSAGGGAIAGGAIGGPVGAIAGGLLGGVGGLFGKKKRKKRSTFDKQQQNLYNLEHQGILGQGPLADLYNYDPQAANDVFDKTIANPAYRDLNERAIPSVTGQFRNNGLMNSSYAGDALAKLARDVQEDLDARRTQYLYGEQQDARNARRNAINSIQGRSTFNYDTSPRQGFNIDSILNQVTPERIDLIRQRF